LWVGRDEDRPAFRDLLDEARSIGVAVVHRSQGDGSGWDGARTDVLWPPNNEPPAKLANDNSLVLRLSDGEVHFLLTGDIEQHTEENLVANRAPLAADFLKVPHHGSRTSSTAPFLAAVAPRFAAVSVGEANPFGHPAAATVQRYQQDGVRLLRTDRDGAITAITDGQSLSVQTYAQQSRK
jgi:competence protein ComEC